MFCPAQCSKAPPQEGHNQNGGIKCAGQNAKERDIGALRFPDLIDGFGL